MRQYSGYTISDFINSATSSPLSQIEDEVECIRKENDTDKDRDEWIEIDNSLRRIIYAVKELTEVLGN